MYQINDLKQTIGIPFYSNLKCDTLGLDSLEHCFDRNHYKSYPKVTYSFNEIGFRFKLPTTTTRPILAIGDSFTLGLGVNEEDTWPSELSRILNIPVLNFSLNGASNDWMSRKTKALLEFFDPVAILVHYTFSHRRELPHTDWFDDERTECSPIYTEQENFENWQTNFNFMSSLNLPTVHSFIPGWHTQFVDYTKLPGKVIPPTKIIDLARDGFHYGVQTHKELAKQFTNLLDV